MCITIHPYQYIYIYISLWIDVQLRPSVYSKHISVKTQSSFLHDSISILFRLGANYTPVHKRISPKLCSII